MSRDSLPTRVAVTLAACAALLALEWTPLPMIDPEPWRRFFLAGSLKELSPVALGLVPFITGFVLVEFSAMVVPRLRPLREGSEPGRRHLTRWAWAVSLSIAAMQSWSVATWLQSLRSPYGEAVLPAGWGPALGTATTILAGTATAGWLAGVIGARGLGNGFAVLLAARNLEALALTGLRRLVSAPGRPWSDAALLVLLALVVVVPLVAIHRARHRPTEAPRVPLLTCSLTALQLPAGLVTLVFLVAGWLAIAPSRLRETWAMRTAFPWLELAVVLAVAVPLARLFFPRTAVEAAWARAGVGAEEARRALATAHRWSIGLVMAAAALPIFAAELGAGAIPSDFGVIGAVTLLAVAADLRGEWRARARGDLVPVYAAHRVYEVDPVLHSLAGAGIDAFARARHFRALFHIFAAYSPVEILVAPARAEEAAKICARIVDAAVAAP